MKKQIGVTLTALIITIVILIILATVGITEIKGGGIIAKAKEAVRRTEEAKIHENIIIGDIENVIENSSECIKVSVPVTERAKTVGEVNTKVITPALTSYSNVMGVGIVKNNEPSGQSEEYLMKCCLFTKFNDKVETSGINTLNYNWKTSSYDATINPGATLDLYIIPYTEK